MKIFLTMLCIIFCVDVSHAQSKPNADANGVLIVAPGDTVAMIATKFVWYDKDYASVYQLGYREADDFYKTYPGLMKKYGPAILRRYQMVRVQQEQLACYLYLLGEKEPLITYNKSKMSQNSREVLDMMLNHFHIKLKN